jgi:hypothetical protein
MNALYLSALLIFSSLTLSHAETFVDNFSNPELKERQSQRGDWQFTENTARCKADEALYKKYNNHGPIIKWPRECTAGTVEFEMKAEDCSRVVFTFNGEGHIFRICLTDKAKSTKWIKTRIIAWATPSSKENKGDTIIPKGLPHLNDINNKWVKFKIEVKGKNAKLSLGDFSTSLDHAALTRPKNTIMITFAEGNFSIKNFKFTQPK